MGGARPGDERQADKACAFATEAFALDKHYFDKPLERNTHPSRFIAVLRKNYTLALEILRDLPLEMEMEARRRGIFA